MNIPGTAAAVTGTHENELMLFFTLLELTLIILAGRIGGALAKRCGQSRAVGEIIIGIALGPSLFGLLAPHAFDYVFHSAPPEPLTILSNLGLVLLMFQIGLEFDFAHLTERVNRAAVLRVSIACLVLPFACGFALGFFIAENSAPAARINTALFIATAFSITAVPILGRIMMELNLTRTRLGVIAISSAAVNDVVGWLMLALVTTLTVSDFVAGRFALRVAMVAAFGLISMLVVRPVLKKAIRLSRPRDAKMSANLLGGLLAVIFIAAMTTRPSWWRRGGRAWAISSRCSSCRFSSPTLASAPPSADSRGGRIEAGASPSSRRHRSPSWLRGIWRRAAPV